MTLWNWQLGGSWIDRQLVILLHHLGQSFEGIVIVHSMKGQRLLSKGRWIQQSMMALKTGKQQLHLLICPVENLTPDWCVVLMPWFPARSISTVFASILFCWPRSGSLCCCRLKANYSNFGAKIIVPCAAFPEQKIDARASRTFGSGSDRKPVIYLQEIWSA